MILKSLECYNYCDSVMSVMCDTVMRIMCDL